LEINAQTEESQTGQDTTGFIIAPMAAAAALDAAAFSRVNASEAVPATWEERARKAWEYYVEEPLVENCVNSWRTFVVGDEIKIAGDDDNLKTEAAEAVPVAGHRRWSQFCHRIGESAKDDGHDPRDQAGRP